jgi:drug/metabolite transporter (DMT)-like permease
VPDGSLPVVKVGRGGVVEEVWIGLCLALVSALAVNWAYTKEHEAAAALPPLSPRRPFRSLRLLLRHRDWLIGFATETAGWLIYVAALRLAPLSLVQAVSASGIAVLALFSVQGHPGRLALHERFAVGIALVGLVLLSLSLVGSTPSSHAPHPVAVVLWLAASAGVAVVLIAVHIRLSRAAALGLAAGLLFADGDISAKLVSSGGIWLLALLPLVACYAAGTSVLQVAFQHGSALTAAGVATLVTNAVPIAAGFVLFDESLPPGARGVLQIAAFASIVASAGLLGSSAAARSGSSKALAEPAPSLADA